MYTNKPTPNNFKEQEKVVCSTINNPNYKDIDESRTNQPNDKNIFIETNSLWTETKPNTKKYYKTTRSFKSNYVANPHINLHINSHPNTYQIEKKWIQIRETWDQYVLRIKKADNQIKYDGKKNCEWVYKIFEGKQELECVECVTKDLIIFSADGKPFDEVIRTSPNNFDLLVMPFDTQIRTIRDLRSKHIELLEKMSSKADEVLTKHLGSYDKNLISKEFHYVPSTYHLHLHVMMDNKSANLTNSKSEFELARIHKLDVVINNLRLDSNFYSNPVIVNIYSSYEKWLRDLKKYENDNILTGPHTNIEYWKNFIDMDCYKNYNCL